MRRITSSRRRRPAETELQTVSRRSIDFLRRRRAGEMRPDRRLADDLLTASTYNIQPVSHARDTFLRAGHVQRALHAKRSEGLPVIIMAAHNYDYKPLRRGLHSVLATTGYANAQ